MSEMPRRGWREKVEAGIYRAHRVACPSSRDTRPGRRCTCPFQIVVPGLRPGATRLVTVDDSISAVRAERRRLLSAGRPEPEPDAAAVTPSTLDELAAAYFSTREATLAPNTIADADSAYRLRIAPVLGHLALTEITRERVEVWLADLVRRSSSQRMVRSTAGTLRLVLAAGVEWGRLTANPAARLRLPAPDASAAAAVERVLNDDQLRHLLSSGTPSLRVETILRAAGEAGLRRGEIIALRWTDVRLTERRLDVRRSAWQVSGEKGERVTKGRRARRVAVSERFAERLADWYAVSVVEHGANAAGFVWPGCSGGPMDAHTPTQATARALERAGLVDGEGLPLVTLHGLRHTAASIMLARGVPLIVVSRQLGHADPKITASTYAHLLGDSELDRAATVFDTLDEAGTLRETLREARDHA